MKDDRDTRIRQLERALAETQRSLNEAAAQARRGWEDLSRVTRDRDAAVAKCREAERRADVAEDTARELQGQFDRAIAQRDEARARWQAIDDEPGRTIKSQDASIAALRGALQRMVEQCWQVYCHACAEVADTVDGHMEHCTVPDAVRVLAGHGADAPEGRRPTCLQCEDPGCPGSPEHPTRCTMKARACKRFVATQLEVVRSEARKIGYAVAVHGSLARDVDLVAVPWVEQAEPPELLIEAIVQTVDGSLHTDPDPGKTRPHGRRSWSVVLPGFGNTYLDVSVMPREDPLLAERLRLTKQNGCGDCARDAGMLEYLTPSLCAEHANGLRYLLVQAQRTAQEERANANEWLAQKHDAEVECARLREKLAEIPELAAGEENEG